MTRNTDARPGSAWDAWHAAGYAYGQTAGNLEDDALEDAASTYSDARPFPPSVVRRAFKEGARQGAASSHTTGVE